MQEAWVAHLEGRDPVKAAHAYAERERRFRERHEPLPDEGDDENEN